MKKFTLLSLLSISIVTAFAQTIPNLGFETWANNTETQTTYLAPQGWITQDEFYTAFRSDSIYAVHSVTQTTSSHSGTYAVNMAVVTSNEGDTVNGYIVAAPSVIGYITDAFSGHALGYPYASRPANFSGYYKANTVSTDYAQVALYMTKWNTMTNSRDTLVDTLVTLSNQSAWTQFNIALHYRFAEYPDSLVVGAGIQIVNYAHIGSSMSVDDFGFSGNVAIGVHEISAPLAEVNLFPNPFNDKATVEIRNVRMLHATMEIFDVLGNQVRSVGEINDNTIQLDRDGLESGMYFYTITNEKRVVAMGKFSVE